MANEYSTSFIALNTDEHENSSALPYATNIHGNSKFVERRSEARRNGQNLAGSGALVFEGELLEIPIWN